MMVQEIWPVQEVRYLVFNNISPLVLPAHQILSTINIPWIWHYTAIRSANIFLANVMDSPLGAAEKQSSYNQARFLRAYNYHELFRWFGPLVISTEPLDPFAFETKRETLQTP
jgi:hypothetical protein